MIDAHYLILSAYISQLGSNFKQTMVKDHCEITLMHEINKKKLLK
jgi:hypothetical protein